MVRAKAKISEKSLDVLKTTKKSAPKASSEPKAQAVRARSRSRSRTPGRPPKTPKVSPPAKPVKPKKASRAKKAPKRLGQTPAEKNAAPIVKRGRGRPSLASQTPVASEKKTKSPVRKVTPKPRKTPTRASTRAATSNSSQATAYTLRQKVRIDETDVSGSNLSISSSKSASGGWFSKCSIV